MERKERSAVPAIVLLLLAICFVSLLICGLGYKISKLAAEQPVIPTPIIVTATPHH